MRIAVNIGLLQHGAYPETYDAMVDLFFSIAKQQPYHYFIFLSYKDVISKEKFLNNTQHVTVSTKYKRLPFFYRLLDYTIAKILRKHKADVFIGVARTGGFRLKVPQVLLTRNLDLFNYKGGWLQKKRLHRCMQNAQVICTPTQFLKQKIIDNIGVKEDKLINTGSFVKPIYKPADINRKEMIKEAYAEGYEYFLFLLNPHTHKNFLTVLKAYSIFKKWQKTGMKLLVAQNAPGHQNFMTEQLKTFKYREDVKMLNYLPDDELSVVLASSYAFLFPATNDNFTEPVLQAMQCNVPIITTDNGGIAEVGADAVLYADPQNPTDIAGQMKTIFKDEQLRNNLISCGALRAETYSLQKTTGLVWQAIQQAVSD